MKQLKFGVLTLLMFCMLIGIESTAYGIGNASDKNRLGLEQNNYRLGDKGPNGGKVVYVDATDKHGLEAKTEDELNSMTWDAAVISVQGSGSGWRLPTTTELVMLYEHKKIIGGFSNEDYWSSTEQDVNSAWIQGFRLGDKDRYNKQSKLRVRFIRSF